jgi:hypothetical protein
MDSPATEIARRLADNAEAVCRRYLSKGRREGRYWLVGDAHNTPGRSLYVRLAASPDGRGVAGKWTDAENGEHGDLLDIIAKSCGHSSLRETLGEARHFLSLPTPALHDSASCPRPVKAPTGTPEAARRLWSASKAATGSVVQRYLAGRAITRLDGCEVLRFHPRCFYRASQDDVPDVRSAWPAMIAAVTDLTGAVTGVQRSWLDGSTAEKAPIAYPRRAMGQLLGSGVRFGQAGSIMVAGEGIETVLSLRQVMPDMPMIAGLSATHLAATTFPANLRRLYVARDDDPAGTTALDVLRERADPLGIEIVPLEPRLDDFNDDLRAFGITRLAAAVRVQLVPEDAQRFLS